MIVAVGGPVVAALAGLTVAKRFVALPPDALPLAAMFSALAGVWLFFQAFTHLIRPYLATQIPGHCRGCGYDVQATPDRCPECGIESPAAVLRPAGNAGPDSMGLRELLTGESSSR